MILIEHAIPVPPKRNGRKLLYPEVVEAMKAMNVGDSICLSTDQYDPETLHRYRIAVMNADKVKITTRSNYDRSGRIESMRLWRIE